MSASNPTNAAAEVVGLQYLLCSHAVDVAKALRDLRLHRQAVKADALPLDKATNRLRRLLSSIRAEIRRIDAAYSDSPLVSA